MPEPIKSPYNAKPLKEDELRKFSRCSACQRLLGQTGTPMFFILTIDRHILDLNAVNRQQGLAMILGGNGLIARALGPDE